MGNSASSDLSVRFLSGCHEIPSAPASPEVQRLFDEMLQLRGVAPELATEINSMESNETKWMNKLAREGGKQQEWLEPHQCVQQVEHLHDEAAPISDLFRAIRINILLQDSAWGTQFLHERGLAALLKLLQTDKAAAPIVPVEILNVLFVLMCQEGGTAALVQEPTLCGDLLAMFQSTPLRTLKARVLRLLTIICRDAATGRAVLLSGLDSCKSSDNLRFALFTPVFESLQDGEVGLLVAMTLFLEVLMLPSPSSPDQSDILRELKVSGALRFLERIQSGSLKTNAAATDDMLAVKAASIVRICEELCQPRTEAVAETRFAKATEEAGNVSYHVDLTESAAIASPQDRREESVDMRSASTFKLHIPGASIGFGSAKSPQKMAGSPLNASTSKVVDAALLPEVLSQLQLHSQQLDSDTSAKLTGLLAQISASLADAKASMAKGVVDMLEQSLSRHGRSPTTASPHRQASSLLGRSVSPLSGDADTALRRVKFELFSGNPSTSTEDEPNGERVASEAHTESVDESHEPSTGSPAEERGETHRRPSIKLPLPLFQSFRKGPGIGATPACTPIATASVRKDAKRHSFPSHVSESLFVLEEVSPDPAARITVAETGSLAAAAPPTPPSNDLSRFRRLLAMGAPRDAVRAKMVQAGVDPNLLDEEPQGFAPSPRAGTSVASTTTASPATASASTESTPIVDVSKFRKLLAMGAPMAAVKSKMVQAGVDPSLLDQQQAEGAHPPPAPLTVQATTESGTADASKFKKLLTMGAPLAAVKAKMVQASLDPALLDGPVATTPPPVVALPTPKALVKNDLEYAKFFKLLAMGAPSAAVKAKMTQAGLNPALLDTPDAEMPRAQTEASSVPIPDAAQPVSKVKDHPDYAKFFKLLSMGAPVESVKAKIRMAGLNPDLLDTPDADMPNATLSSAAVKVKDDPNYSKFFKLLSMGAPSESVKAKMRMAGLNADLLDTPDAELSPPAAAATEKPPVKVRDDPEYAKFFKLLAMNAPIESVKAKMRMAGLNADLLDTPDAFMPSTQPAQPAAAPVKVKDDPEYAKFFKLLSMNAPIESVKAKMRMAGLNADLLDTPDAVVPSKSAPAATPVGRRAHLSLAIPPPVKQTTRPFYWQHLRGDAIKGTVWEEIERESTNQNNEVPLVLSDSDLAALESEFPPPNKDGPVTGGRQRSGSLDMGPMSPGSPLCSPRVVFLIDRSRANNISIIVKQFRVSNAALCEAIMKVDASVINLERVQGLIKILPTEEEMAAITAFQGDPATLNEAERILKELMTVPRLKQRLSSLLATLQFPGLVRDLEERVEKVRNASREVAESIEFKSVLQVVLQVGNKMNKGTNRGSAKGFRLSDLTKLAQTKSVDRSVTLLHYVARMVRLKKGNMVHLSDSLSSLYGVQNVPIPELQGDMSKVSEVVETVSVELTAQKLKNSIEEQEPGDRFVPVMAAFLETATLTTAVLKESLQQTMELLEKTMKRFDKDPDDDTTATGATGIPNAAVVAGAGEFFSTVYEFSVALSKADRDNEVKRVREEKRLKQQQLKTQIPVRSHSSLDLLGRRSNLKAEGEPGPETPEKGRASGDPETNECSRPARSASMSAIIGTKPAVSNDTVAGQSPLAVAKTSMTKIMSAAIKPAKTGDASNDRSRAGSAKKQGAATPTDSGKPPPHLRAPTTGKRDEAQQAKDVKKDRVSKKSPKTILTTPGKIIRATKNVSSMSPLKSIVSGTSSNVVSPLQLESPAPSIEKSRMKPLSIEKVVPFDGSSIGEIRMSLETKHGARASPREGSSTSKHPRGGRGTFDNNRSSASPEENASEAELSSSNLSLQVET